MDLNCNIISPSENHTHTVVFLHGRGDNAKNFSYSLAFSPDSQGRSLMEVFPTFRWIFPSSKLRPCTSDGGHMWSQWFDVWNTNDFKDKEELQAVGLKESVFSVRKILVEEAALLDGQWDRIILMGISQGAATSVHTLLNLDVRDQKRTPRRLGAFLGFSCRMPFLGRTLADTRAVLDLDDAPSHDEVLRNTPVLLEHCVDDPLIPIAYGHALQETLTGYGAIVEWKEYPRGGHWFNSPQGIDDAVTFIKERVPGVASAEESSSRKSGTVTNAADLL